MLVVSCPAHLIGSHVSSVHFPVFFLVLQPFTWSGNAHQWISCGGASIKTKMNRLDDFSWSFQYPSSTCLLSERISQTYLGCSQCPSELTHIYLQPVRGVQNPDAEKKASDGCIDFRAPEMRVSCVGACQEKRWLPGRLADVQLTQSAAARPHFRTAQPAIMWGGQRPSKVMEARAGTGLCRGWHLVGF